MRVVLDANVFVSAAINSGSPSRIVQTWLESDTFDVAICPKLLAEVTKVLIDRPRMRRWIDVDMARRYVDAITTTDELVADPTEIEMLTRDPGDDYVVALARENEADFIVTGDKDLLEWPEQRPPVVAPAAFEAVLQASIVPGTGMGL